MFTSGKWAVFLFWAGRTGIKIFLVDLSPPGLHTGIFSSPTLICPDAACHCWRNSARICCNGRWVTTLSNSTQLWMWGLPHPPLSAPWGFWISWAIEKESVRVGTFECGSAKSMGGMGIPSAGWCTGNMLADTGRRPTLEGHVAHQAGDKCGLLSCWWMGCRS